MDLLSEQEGIAEGGRVDRSARTGKRVSDLPGVAFQRVAASRCAQEDVTKRQPILGPELLRMGSEMGRELLIARLYGRHILCKEFHLLPHTAANDDVIAVETRRAPFP